MRQIIKILTVQIAVVGLFMGSVPSTLPLYAHDDEPMHEHAGDQANNQQSDYAFTTPVSCSLSLLTRRALQLYDENAEDIALSPAQAMFTETNVVKQMGDRWLEVGEKVTIQRSLIDNYAKQSQSLTPEQVAAWQYYANQADFNVSDIKTDSEAQAATTNSSQSDLATNESQDKPQNLNPSPKSSSPAWYLWLLVGAALAGMYVLMDRPRKK